MREGKSNDDRVGERRIVRILRASWNESPERGKTLPVYNASIADPLAEIAATPAHTLDQTGIAVIWHRACSYP